METKARETAGLIGSDKVEGTTVYDAHGEKVGSIERVMTPGLRVLRHAVERILITR